MLGWIRLPGCLLMSYFHCEVWRSNGILWLETGIDVFPVDVCSIWVGSLSLILMGIDVVGDGVIVVWLSCSGRLSLYGKQRVIIPSYPYCLNSS